LRHEGQQLEEAVAIRFLRMLRAEALEVARLAGFFKAEEFAA
jgi:hypothetical protein